MILKKVREKLWKIELQLIILKNKIKSFKTLKQPSDQCLIQNILTKKLLSMPTSIKQIKKKKTTNFKHKNYAQIAALNLANKAKNKT